MSCLSAPRFMAKGHGEVQTLHDAAKHGHRHRVFVTLTSFGTSNSLQLELESLSEPPPFHMTGSQLPPELIHQIVQELGDDFETLKDVFLSFPGWLPWVRVPLFCTLSIHHTLSSGVTARRDYSFLQAYPHIVPYIRKIRLMEHYSHLSPPDPVANDPYVPLLLNLLFRVQDLYRLFSRCLAATWPLTCRDHKRIDARHDVMLCRLVWIRSSDSKT